MLVPGSKELRFAQARRRVSCTRSSARSTLPDSEIAKALRLGTAPSIASLTEGGGFILTILYRPVHPRPHRPRGDGSAQRNGPAPLGCRPRCKCFPAASLS